MPAIAPSAPDTRRVGARRWPTLCAVCRGWGLVRVCGECRDRFAAPAPRCRRCALPLPAAAETCGRCLADPPSFDASIACVDYGHPWDRLITAFKFHAALDLAPTFAQALTAAVAEGPGHDAGTLLVPVPLAPGRLKERGYNQAWELARRVAHGLGLEADRDLLVRIRDTAHQLELPPDARSGNVRGAFAVEPRRRASLQGRPVAVVDDVMTTGATLAEIARVLKQAGAARVEAWVFARTPAPGRD